MNTEPYSARVQMLAARLADMIKTTQICTVWGLREYTDQNSRIKFGIEIRTCAQNAGPYGILRIRNR